MHHQMASCVCMHDAGTYRLPVHKKFWGTTTTANYSTHYHDANKANKTMSRYVKPLLPMLYRSTSRSCAATYL